MNMYMYAILSVLRIVVTVHLFYFYNVHVHGHTIIVSFPLLSEVQSVVLSNIATLSAERPVS